MDVITGASGAVALIGGATMGGSTSHIVRVRGDYMRAEAALEISEFVTIDSLMTVQNLEGIAVHPLPGGSGYFDLVADDIFQPLQRRCNLCSNMAPERPHGLRSRPRVRMLAPLSKLKFLGPA